MWSARAGLGDRKWGAVSHVKGRRPKQGLQCALDVPVHLCGLERTRWVFNKAGFNKPDFISAIGGRVAPYTFGTMLNFVADLQDQWGSGATLFYLLK